MHPDRVEDFPVALVSRENELIRLNITTNTTIPGHPMIAWDNELAVQQILKTDLCTARLRGIYKLLFLTSRPVNTSPLHHQSIKGRQIFLTEKPDLHLLWHYDRIFIKPVPKYLFSSDFWLTHMVRKNARDGVEPATQLGQDEHGQSGEDWSLEAMGFLRSYSQLIRHESDFDLAKDFRLIPSNMGITWESWCRFIANFSPLRNRDVSMRYHYGEIRLTRLNFWTIVLYGKSYAKVHHTSSAFFSRFGAPYIFIFGALTVLLTALQTGLAVFPEDYMGSTTYHVIATGFVPFSLVLTMAGLCFLPFLFTFFQVLKVVNFFRFHHPLS